MNTSANQSLGDRLRQSSSQQHQQDVANATAQEQDRIAEAKALLAKEERSIQAFFDTAKRRLEADIFSGSASKGVQLGYGENDSVAKLIATFRNEVVSPEHRYHAFWLDFKAWAIRNGLTATWTHQWDTGATNTWVLVGVTAR